MIRHFLIGFHCLVCTALSASVLAQESDEVKFVQPFVGETTFAILKVDAKQVEVPDASKLLDATTADAKEAFSKVAKALEAALQQLRALADDQPIYATAGIPISKARLPVYFFRGKTSAKNVEDTVAFVQKNLRAEAVLHNEYIVVTPHESTIPTSSPPPGNMRAIASAFAATGDYPVQLLVLPPDYVWRTVRELSPELPPQLGGGTSRVLTDGVRWASIGIDPQTLRIELVIQSTDNESARAFSAYLPTMLNAIYKTAKLLSPKVPTKLFDMVIDSMKPKVEGSQVKIRVDGLENNKVKLAVLATIARNFESRFRRRTHVSRFKQILLGMHNYHDSHRVLPPADKFRDKNDKLGLSWRVHILPYIEQQALYEQFHLDEPWDSPNNKKLLEKMPEVFARNVNDPTEDRLSPGYTTFLAPVGEKTVFGGAKSTKFQQITDGTSTTVALVEVAMDKAVPWTAPDDFLFDPNDPLSGVQIGKNGTWLCAFADGSVHQLRADISKKAALHLFQMSDGNPVSLQQLR